MTAYFDTSALIPLIIDEPSSAICERAWRAARRVASSTLAYVEARAALAQARRLGRLSDEQHDEATSGFDDLWAQIATITPAPPLLRHAANLSGSHALRGYDAVHCASALALRDSELFAVSGDHALLGAWRDLGLTTVDINGLAGSA